MAEPLRRFPAPFYVARVARQHDPDTAKFPCKRPSKPGGNLGIGHPEGRAGGAWNQRSPLMLSLDQLVRTMRSPSNRTSAFTRIAAAKIVLALAQGERSPCHEYGYVYHCCCALSLAFGNNDVAMASTW
jgi:hypothetical protein